MEIEEIIEVDETPLEYQVFALSFREPGAITSFAENLDPQTVGAIHGDHGVHEFYNAILDFHRETRLDPVDPIAFKAWLQTETDIYDVLGGSGGVDFFVDTLQHVELSNVDSVIKVLNWKANRRRQMNHMQALQSILSKKGHKTDEDVAKIRELTEKIQYLEGDLDANPLDKVETADDIIRNANELMTIPPFLPTPFRAYNRALGYTDDGGYFRGAVHAVVAPSGKGKSTFTKNLANYWLDCGYRVLTINFEEAKNHWERILMTQILKENVYKYADTWSEEEKRERLDLFKDKLEEWGDRLMVRHDPESIFFEDIEIWLKDIIGHNDRIPDIVIIDTIQSMITKRSGGPRWGEYEAMMIRLERLAKEMNAVFIITAQQNNEAAKEKREVLEQRDVGGSVTIVQKCSVITLITPKKSVTGDDSDDDEIMQLQIIKNRITGGSFTYDPPLVIYRDESKSYEEFEIVDREEYEMAQEIAEDIFGLEDFLG